MALVNDGLAALEITPRPVLPDMSIVIPTLGRPILEASLCAIVCGTTWPARIIVVDQSSSPEVAAWMKRLQSFGLAAEHVPSSQRGRAAGVNRGIERVKTQFFAVTDDDCFVDPDWVEKMTARLRLNPEAIVTGRVLPYGDEEAVTVKVSTDPFVVRRRLITKDCLSGGNMGTSMAVIERIGKLDEDPCLRVAEDNEYSYRALRSGVPIFYAPEVCLRHVGWRNSAERADQYWAYARSHGGFYGKYLRQGDWFIALRVVMHLLRALKRWIRGIITGNREASLNGRAYVLGLLPGILAGWRSSRPL